ncbi:MAG: type IV secretion system protein [Rhodospirillales bacterium]|nr:type IV secretion system protein [Rhodospirillales bacterium]
MSEGQNNTSSENAKGIAILLCVFFCLFLLFWYFWGDDVKSGFRFFRWGEMWLISFFIDDDYTVYWNGHTINFYQWLEGVPNIPGYKLTKETLDVISFLALHAYKWFFIVVLSIMGLWAYQYGPGTQFRRKMGMDDLIATQAKTFPVLTPLIDFNPSKMPPRPPGAPVPAELPLFSEALGPEEWLAYNQIPIPDGKIDERAAYIAFAHQLGPRWKGPAKLPPHKKIFLATCCLRASRKRAEADEMMGRLAQCWRHDKGLQLGRDKKLLRDAMKVLKNKDLSASTLAKVNQHAFQTTALIRALATAREEGGVMAPAQFVWMRGHDRALWYPLNNLGRQAFHMEALGAMAHYVAEKRTQRPVPKPKVDDAVRSIVDYMNSNRARPVPQLDYSGSKRSGIKKPGSAGVKKPKA